MKIKKNREKILMHLTTKWNSSNNYYHAAKDKLLIERANELL